MSHERHPQPMKAPDALRPRRGALAWLLPAAVLWMSLWTAASAAEVGWRNRTLPGDGPDALPTEIALWYPTQATPRSLPMGPFTVQAAPGAAPEPQVAGLVLISHGTGGSELGHARIAEALARRGWLVVALRHPRDNWQDASLIRDSALRYFDTRPRQASRVLDLILSDPEWGPRIARDGAGPRVAVIGHSAGGYTVLALAGGRPDVTRIARHCTERRAEDPIFCGTGRAGDIPASLPASPSLRDARVRAAIALAPVGVVLDPASLAAISIPVAVHVPMGDRWLVPRFHGESVAALIPGATLERVDKAWHFAYMDTPSMPIPTPDGDVGADPHGFDRAAYLKALGPRLADYLDVAMTRTQKP